MLIYLEIFQTLYIEEKDMKQRLRNVDPGVQDISVIRDVWVPSIQSLYVTHEKQA